MEKKLYKVFYKTINGNESYTFIEADGEETIKAVYVVCRVYKRN